ncbi:unnamed protein product, partial [Timema podura]|nr:unnamed protein product [Timema podura]
MNIDKLKDVEKKKIKTTNFPKTFAGDVLEFSMGLCMSLQTKLQIHDHNTSLLETQQNAEDLCGQLMGMIFCDHELKLLLIHAPLLMVCLK